MLSGLFGLAALTAFVGMAFAGERGDTGAFALYGLAAAVLWGIAWRFAAPEGECRRHSRRQR